MSAPNDIASPRRGGARTRDLGGMPIVLTGLILWNLGNYVFFVIAGRTVGPAQYATVAALLSTTMLIQIPSGAIQVGISRQVAALTTKPDAIAALLRFAMLRCLIWGVVVGAATVAITMLIAPSLGTVNALWTGATTAPMPLYSFASGVLQGQQRFRRFALSVSMLGLPRPVFLLLCFLVMHEITSAIAASALTIVAACVTTVMLAWPAGVERVPPPLSLWRGFLRTIAPLAVGLAGFGALVNVDVIVARASLPERIAGLFGAIAVLGKATVIFPQAVAWILLPRVSVRHARGQRTGSLLVLGVAVCAVLVLVAAGVAWLFDDQIVRLVFGSEFVDGARYLPPLILTTGLIGILLLLMNHQLGRGDDRFAVVMAGLAVLQGLLLAVVHDTVEHLLLIEFVVGALGLVIHEAIHTDPDAGLCRSIHAMLTADKGRHSA